MAFKLEVTNEEVSRAWQRTKRDKPNRCFVTHPHLVEWIESDLSEWIEELRDGLRNGYTPSASRICMVPKPGSMFRPALVLSIEDEVVYNLILSRLYPRVHSTLLPAQGEPDVAYQLSTNPDAANWIIDGLAVWKQMRERSIEKLDASVSHVVVTDIAGYYDNLDMGRVIALLKDAGCDHTDVSALQECLHRWNFPRQKGIPQGFTASDILGKLYFKPIDDMLASDGVIHLRYVDDIRIFTQSFDAARRAIERLSELCHSHGLTIQSAKTKILDKDEARKQFDDVQHIIQDITQQLLTDLKGSTIIDTASFPEHSILQALEEVSDTPPQVLEKTFRERFSIAEGAAFNKTLFHFLLTRLGKARSTIAVDYCLDSLRSRPEETGYILRYLGSVDLLEHQQEKLSTIFVAAHTVNDYQVFELLRWFYDRAFGSPALVRRCLVLAVDRNVPPWVRSYASAYIGQHGAATDLVRLQEQYAKEDDELVRAELVAALSRLEPTARSTFFGRVKQDGKYIKRAIGCTLRSLERESAVSG